ncbi:TetR/AcrR family transcriptional regulator [Spongisporangium articulatum]|uniref:TetR/AcrR family transcriptional regulator n=1 Tax=Spongisporangium articulatum TaxID=3362603 RepID=A0ABW8AL60_9ACTN
MSPTAKDTRERMVEGAVRLLATKGLQGASLGEVLEATGAPRGSIYHHFPGGKDELVAAAMQVVGDRTLTDLRALSGATPETVTAAFLDKWRTLLLGTDFRAGCGVLAVTVAAEQGPLLDAARAVFREWRAALAELFVAGGAERPAAESFSTILLAATEGAVVLSRADRGIEAFETVAAQLTQQARTLG